MVPALISAGSRAWSVTKLSKIGTTATGRSRWFSRLFWSTEAALVSSDVWNELDDDPTNDPDFWDVMLHLVSVGIMIPGVSKRLVLAKDVAKSAALAAMAHLPKMTGLRTHVSEIGRGNGTTFGKYVITLFKGNGELIATNKYGDKVIGISKKGVKTYKDSTVGRKVAFVGGTSTGALLVADALDGDLDSLNMLAKWLETMASIIDPDGKSEVVAETIRDAFYAISDPDFRRSQIQLDDPSLDATECQLEMMKSVVKALDYARDAMNSEASPDGAIIENDDPVKDADAKTEAPLNVSKGETQNDGGTAVSPSSKTDNSSLFTTPRL